MFFSNLDWYEMCQNVCPNVSNEWQNVSYLIKVDVASIPKEGLATTGTHPGASFGMSFYGMSSLIFEMSWNALLNDTKNTVVYFSQYCQSIWLH